MANIIQIILPTYYEIITAKIKSFLTFIDDHEPLITFFGFIILTATLFIYIRQINIQNRLYKAQVLRDRFDMYNETEELITEEHIKDFKRFPEDYIKKSTYWLHYLDQDDKIFKYLYFGKKYTYLLFVYTLKERLKLHDVIGDAWEKESFKNIKKYPEFHDVREFNKKFYSDFDKYLEIHIKKITKSNSMKQNITLSFKSFVNIAKRLKHILKK